MGPLIMILQFVLGILIIVGLHELGHLLAAKYFGMRVEKYYIGFPPRLFRVKFGETEYALGLIPLGGFVKIAGMIDESMDKAQMEKEPQPWEFRAKPAWQRLIVMLGGILLNVLTGVFVFAILIYAQGETFVPGEEVRKHGIVAHELAEEMGLKTGDQIRSVNGQDYQRFEDLIRPEVFLSEKSYYEVHRKDSQFQFYFPTDFADKYAAQVQKGKPFISPRVPYEVGELSGRSPAYEAGLRPGDKLLAIEQQPVNYFDQLQQTLTQHAGDTVKTTLERQQQLVELSLPVSKAGKLGIPIQPLTKTSSERYSLPESFQRGTRRAFTIVWTNAKGLLKIVKGEISAQKSLTGPIGMAKMFGSHWHWQRFWHLIGLLSMVLAFMNILPIPALDGGHALFCLYEMVSGKAPPTKFLTYAQQAGMALLLGLIAFVLFNDILKLWD